MSTRPRSSRPASRIDLPACWLALVTTDVELRLRAVAVRLHVRRSVHRRIRFGRVADAHRMAGGSGEIWWSLNVNGARRREGCGYVRFHGNRLLRPSEGGSAIGAGRRAMAGALVEWFRRNGTEKGWSDRACSCMAR